MQQVLVVLEGHLSKLAITSKEALISDIHKEALSLTSMGISRDSSKVIGSDV